MARSALLAFLPAVLIATGWRQLEFPAEGRELALVALLGAVVAFSPRRAFQLAASIAGLLVTVHLAFGLRPVGGVFTELASGLVDYYEFALPFNPSEHERMHGVVLLAVFAFTLAAALAIARRRAILAAATTFAGAAWPVTLIRDAPSTARGILLLLTALILLAALRLPESRRGAGQAVLVGAGVVLAAVIAVSSPAVAKGGFLNWEQWEPYGRPDKPVEVDYVWNADYDGIVLPTKATTVLTIKAPRRGASYWRATTLDVFIDDHWIDDPMTISPVRDGNRDTLISDPLVPPAGRNPDNWMRQEVTVRALRDEHLVGATVPIAFERDAAIAYSPGVAHASPRDRGDRYQVWSYAPQPGPQQLARSRPEYPELISSGSFLAVQLGNPPPFGQPGREGQMDLLFDLGGTDGRLYRPLYDVARRVVGEPRNPYAAVIALEAWFRSGAFTYDESPPASPGVPPLVAFVNEHRHGYCQHFAGAMALMLRFLGIPARVGAGFTTGRYDNEDDEWVVADKNAHTWVEVWFDGFGWMPFDPTPGRGRLLSTYTASSIQFDVSGARDAVGDAIGLGYRSLREGRGRGARNPDLRGLDPAGRAAGRNDDGSSGGGGIAGSLVALLLLIATATTAVLWAVKLLRRRARYLTRDPRRLAGAVRLDLVDFLVDQQLPITASATPAELGGELERSIGIRGERLAEALAEARYGPEAGAEDAVGLARRELRIVRRRLRRRLGLRDRLRGLLSLRSLGLGAP